MPPCLHALISLSSSLNHIPPPKVKHKGKENYPHYPPDPRNDPLSTTTNSEPQIKPRTQPGEDGRGEAVSLKAARRLASGSRTSPEEELLLMPLPPPPVSADKAADDGEEDKGGGGGAGEISRHGRFLEGLSPVDCRIMSRVCHPVVERSWKDSARSCWVATRQRRASSSCREERGAQLA
jgi:hypothetical protein